MTVHRAKGLEFPVVVLADIGAKSTAQNPSRYVDTERGLCAVRLAGWSPWELLDHEAEELARDRAEGVRVAYVAATRARDLLVVPAVGDDPFASNWEAAAGRLARAGAARGVSGAGAPARARGRAGVSALRRGQRGRAAGSRRARPGQRAAGPARASEPRATAGIRWSGGIRARSPSTCSRSSASAART